MTAPQDVRLRTTGALEITLYTRPGCHLCEEAKAAIEPLVEEFGARLREVNIDEDRDLTDRYGWDIPVLFVGTRKVAKHRVNLEQFRRCLEEARKKSNA
jgi:glutaredoxin